MTNRERAAAACYLLPAVLLVAFGLRYSVASEFMPYHEAGMQRSWQELPPHERGVMLAALRGGGGGFLFGGVTILVLLAVPFRRGEAWAYRALPALVGLSGALALHTALTLTLLTPASAPWPAAVATIGLALAGFALAPAPAPQRSARANDA
jgi:hypothetical protein